MEQAIQDIKDRELIPVIIAHYGNHSYLRYVIEIAAKNNYVFLLGDASNTFAVDNQKSFHVLMSEYDRTAHEFKKYFKNYSTYDEQYAWFINARVFMTNQFLQAYNLPYCFFVDSDNFVFINVSEYQFDRSKSYYTLLSNFDNPYRMAAQIGNAFLTRHALDKFEQLCYEIYNTNEGMALIQPKIDYHHREHKPGGICEMTLFYLLSQRIPFVNIFEIKDGCIFDHHLATSEYLDDTDYFIMNSQNKIKVVSIKNNAVYIKDKNGNDIKIFNIHFQGRLKNLIPIYYQQLIKLL